MGVDECAISLLGSPERPRGDARLLPAVPRRRAPAFLRHRRLSRRRRRVLERPGHVASSTIDDPAADPAEVALLQSDGYRALVMLPLVAKGQSIGLVELLSRSPIALDAERP